MAVDYFLFFEYKLRRSLKKFLTVNNGNLKKMFNVTKENEFLVQKFFYCKKKYF